jgi:predicted small lipoprotein YifL
MDHKYQILGSEAARAPMTHPTLPEKLRGAAYRVPAMVALSLLCLSACGCGQKGPLYLPAPTASAPNSPDTVSK